MHGLSSLLSVFIYFNTSYWKPGEMLPVQNSLVRSPWKSDMLLNSPGSDPLQYQQAGQSTIIDILQTFQSAMQKQFSTVNNQLDCIGSRLENIESKQQNLEERQSHIESVANMSTLPSCTPKTNMKRKHVTPTSLQVTQLSVRVCQYFTESIESLIINDWW